MRRMNPLAATVLVIVVPLLLVLVIGLATGAVGLGSPEITFLYVVWAAGLAYVWWPRRPRRQR